MFFFHWKNYVSIVCFRSLTEKNLEVSNKLYGRVAKTAFYVSGGTSLGKTNFSKSFVFKQFLIFRKRLWLTEKIFVRVAKKPLYEPNWTVSLEKHFLKYFVFFPFFSDLESKKFSNFGERILGKILKVHSSSWEQIFQGSLFFWKTNIMCSPILDFEKKFNRSCLKNFEKIVKAHLYVSSGRM